MSKPGLLTIWLLLFATWTELNAQDAKAPSKAGGSPDSDKSQPSSPQGAASKARENETPSPGTPTPDGGSQELTPYEDDPKHRERQHMEDFMNIEERIYVIKRDFNLGRGETCESAQRERKINDKDYWYTLRARQYKIVNDLIAVRVIFTISKTGVHKEYNAVRYQHGLDQPRRERKLMYISPEKTCAILVEDLGKGHKGCQLVQPESAIDNGIPEECDKIYKASCGKKSVQVYEPICRNLPDVTPRHREL
ncbi:uncharacterized protein LOC144103950 [Amblyomma americanum]